MANKSRTVKHLEDLLTMAARDKKVRDALILSVTEGHQSDSVDLSEEDLKLVEAICEDLLRFGGNPDLHPDDARSWALGVLVSATCRVKKDDSWTVHVESIRRDKPISSGKKSDKNKKGK